MANGIPALLGKVANAGNVATLLVADATTLFGGSTQNRQWGIFDDNGGEALSPDSIISINFKRDWRVSDYPMEQGAFQSYNKVITPAVIQLRMTKGGSISERTAFLQAVLNMAKSLDLFRICVPEGYYPNMNMQSYDYNRTSTNGATLLTVDASFIAINVTSGATFSNTAQPNGADAVQGGNAPVSASQAWAT